MPTRASSPKEFTHYHKDGSIWAKGWMAGEKQTGYWEFFRKDGSKMRSGHFENGEQVGEWTTYDNKGAVYKVTEIKPKKVEAESKPAKAKAK
jgi:antitoxin component YwqK of YwqJK toxin-antitoxin module